MDESPATNRSISGRLKNCWLSLLCQKETGESLALFRIACGLTALSWMLSAIARGVAADVWLPVEHGGYRSFDSLPWLFELLGGLNPTTLWSVVGVYLIAAVAVTIGLGGRLSAFTLLQAFLAISDINWDIGGGDCRLASNCLWLLVIAGGTATLSLDCRLRERSWTSDRPVSAWPRYLVFYQLVVVYCATGLQKLSIDWTPAGGYSALYYIMQEPTWQRWDMSWLAWIYPFTQIATAVTWIWEVSAPLLILAAWYRATSERPGRMRRMFNRIGFRRLYVSVGVTMHFGVFIFIDLSLFTWISLSMYTCLFASSEWRSAWRWIRETAGRGQAVDKGTTDVVGNDSEQTRRAANGDQVDATLESDTPAENGRHNWLIRAFVAFHIVAITLAALPAPPSSLTREDLATGDVATNLSAWTNRLNQIGVDVTQHQLEETLWNAADKYGRLRRKVLLPFGPYYRFCGTDQGWKMFVGAHRTPSRLHIDINKDGQWRPIYIQGSREHTWLRTRLNHEHWRTAIFTIVYYEEHDEIRELAKWLAKQARTDFPSADRLRVRVFYLHTPSPSEVKAGAGQEATCEDEITISLQQ